MVFIMMINRRLIGTVSDSKKYIAANVACQWISLAASITMMGAIAHLMQKIYEGTADNNSILITAVVAVYMFCCFQLYGVSELSGSEKDIA